MPAPSSNERGDRTGTARPVPGSKEYTLLDADRKPRRSSTPGQFGLTGQMIRLERVNLARQLGESLRGREPGC